MSKFNTVIDAPGPAGNIFAVLGTATGFLRQLRIDSTEIVALREAVMNSSSYDEALDHIREWFPVDTGDD